jgi:hypothetical protein
MHGRDGEVSVLGYGCAAGPSFSKTNITLDWQKEGEEMVKRMQRERARANRNENTTELSFRRKLLLRLLYECSWRLSDADSNCKKGLFPICINLPNWVFFALKNTAVFVVVC